METAAPSRPAAPAVVAVVVTRNPGPWFDETVAALAAQEYSNLAVLVIDAASDTDPTPRIAAALPHAYVKRLDENPGYGAAANHVREIVDGAAFYCFLHDDAAPGERAITTMVGEALRSNAGIVGGKLVDFQEPRRILQVGESVDKTGERTTLVEKGELDQEQHDSVRDVFVVPGGCTLVRSDLFAAIDGYDPGIDVLNDDLNLCWRAHVAGARVVVAPDAVIRHVEALGDRVPVEQRRHRLIRHRVRTMLSCYSAWHLFRVLPQAVLTAALEVLYALVVGRRGQAGDVVGAWRWNLRRRGEIKAWRAKVAAFRDVPDREIRRFQARGSARVTTFVRGQSGRGGNHSDRAQAAWKELADGVRRGDLRWPIAAWVITFVIVAFGSRHLILQPIPEVGGFLPLDLGPSELFSRYVSGWRDVGLGSESPAPTAFGLLSAIGTVFLGAMGTLRRVLLLGSLLVGLVGAYRLLRPTGSARAQAAALVVYGAIPLGYDAIADARWGALTVYGVAPWIISHLARASGWAPFGPVGGAQGPHVSERSTRSRMLGLGLVLALVSAIDPAVLPLVVVVVAALAVGSLLTGALAGTGRLALVSAAGIGIAVLLHVPWALDFVLPGASWDMVVGRGGSAGRFSLLELLRFDVGPVGASALAVGFPVAGMLPLLIGRGWRFDWAVRSWCVTIALLGLAWAGGEGWLPMAVPPAETILAPAAASLAVATGLGVVAFEIDLRAYGFGWRQVVAALAAAGIVVGALPTLLDAGDGRWYLPDGGLDTTFAFLDEEDPGFRVLWIGDPDVMPLPGFALDDDVVYATTDDGLPSITDGWPGSAEGPTALIEDALGVATDGETSRLGRVLAPMAVRYIVLPRAAAPRPLGGLQRPLPTELVAALDAQLDLATVPVNPSYVVYRNEAALPLRAVVPPTAGRGTVFDVGREELTGAVPVLEDQRGPTTFRGPMSAGSRVLHSVSAADGWELVIDGRPAEKVKLFGWADGYETETGGPAVLRYETDVLRYGMVLIQVLAWVAVVWLLVRARRRPHAPEPVPARSPEVEA